MSTVNDHSNGNGVSPRRGGLLFVTVCSFVVSAVFGMDVAASYFKVDMLWSVTSFFGWDKFWSLFSFSLSMSSGVLGVIANRRQQRDMGKLKAGMKKSNDLGKNVKKKLNVLKAIQANVARESEARDDAIYKNVRAIREAQVHGAGAGGRLDSDSERRSVQRGEHSLNDANDGFISAGKDANSRGDYVKALEYFRRAEQCVDQMENPIRWADTQYLLANALWCNKKYHEAKEKLQAVVLARERALGSKHVDTARAYRSLARVNRSLGQQAKALDLYEKALDIYESKLD